MRAHRLNLVLLALLLASAVANWALAPQPTRRSPSFPLSNMARSRAAESYTANPVLPGGVTLQSPQPGTIARGQRPVHYGTDAAEAERAGRELTQPLEASDPAVLARGAQLFATYCVTCHGPGGLGDGPVTRRGVPPPPSLLADQAKGYADGRLFHILTYGQKNMPGYAPQLRAEDRWRIVAYLRSLQQEAAQ